MVRIDPLEWGANRMQWYVPPVAYDTRARLFPRAPSVPREIVPVERFFVELSVGPPWHAIEHVELGSVLAPGAWTAARLRELIVRVKVGPDSHQEHTSATLGHAKVHGIEDLPAYVVTREPESTKLIL